MDKTNYRLFRRKYLLGCLGKLGEVSKQLQLKDNNLTITLSKHFLLLSVSFSQSVVFPARLCSKPFQHIDIVGPSQAEL